MPYFATSDHVNLYYEDRGSGKPVILIPGLTASRIHFRKQVPELSKRFRVIVSDLRGHGDSDRPEHGLTMGRLAKDLYELMEFLELADASLVGWSLGAHIIFEYIKQYTYKNLYKICIIDMTPCVLKKEGWENGLRGLSRKFGDYTLADTLVMLAAMAEDWNAYSRRVVERLFDKRLLNEKNEFAFQENFKGKADMGWMYAEAQRNTPHVIINLWIALVMQDYRSLLPQIPIPCLITYGEESNYYAPANSEYMKAVIPDAKLVSFPDCGHALHLQDPERFNRELLRFLEP
jgi:non-heme chloroperoxidase